MVTIILFGCFGLFLLMGVPAAFGIGLAALSAILYAGYPITVFTQRMFTAVNSFPLMAIPLFMLAGALMGYGGITGRIISCALAFVGHIRGSLGNVVVVSGFVMGGISGSGVADAAALGSVMVPEMKKRGYDSGFSAALVASCGSIALILPPSIALIIYGVSAMASIGDLFMGGIIPGTLIAVGFLLYSYYFGVKNNYPCEPKISRQEKLRRLVNAIWALAMPVMIIWGIRGGIFTPTEGGAFVSAYALFVGMFVYKEITLRDLPKVCMSAAISTAAIAAIIMSTSLFGWLLSSEQIPQKVTQALLAITGNKILLLILINILLLVVGIFLDSGPAIMLLAPILVPVAIQIGVHPVHFGLIMVINLTIGLLTPPVGTALYVASNISGVPIGRISINLIPFWLIMIAVLLLVTYIPILTTWSVSR